MKGGIGSKLAIIFSLLVLVATSMVGILVYQGARTSLVESSRERLQHTAETIEVRFQASLEAVRKDVLFLAETPPVLGLVRAFAGPYLGEKDGGFWDEETNHTDAEWRDQLEDVIVWQYAMVYGNERDWYDLHPLLDDLVDRAEGGEPESGR